MNLDYNFEAARRMIAQTEKTYGKALGVKGYAIATKLVDKPHKTTKSFCPICQQVLAFNALLYDNDFEAISSCAKQKMNTFYETDIINSVKNLRVVQTLVDVVLRRLRKIYTGREKD